MEKSSQLLIKKVANGYCVRGYNPNYQGEVPTYCNNEEYVFATIAEMAEHISSYWGVATTAHPQPQE